MPSFFRWENSLLRLRGDKIPSLTVVHVKSRPLRRDRRRDVDCFDGTPQPHQRSQLPLSMMATFPLACGNLPTTGRSEHSRIGNELRRSASSCESSITIRRRSSQRTRSDAVEYFLFESRRGPDYLFATSAAVLLRSLGYQTRVVSGLYADR